MSQLVITPGSSTQWPPAVMESRSGELSSSQIESLSTLVFLLLKDPTQMVRIIEGVSKSIHSVLADLCINRLYASWNSDCISLEAFLQSLSVRAANNQLIAQFLEKILM